MNEQHTFAGIGSTAFIIRKEDLQPDTLTPAEGKQWAKVDLSKAYRIKVDSPTAGDVEKVARHLGFVPNKQLEHFMEYERHRADERLSDLMSKLQNVPLGIFISTGNGDKVRYIGMADASAINARDGIAACDVVIDPIHSPHPGDGYCSECISPRITVYPRFRKRRLLQKFRKKLMRYLVRYEGREPFDNIERNIYLNSKAAPTSRRMSKDLNAKIKLCKRKA